MWTSLKSDIADVVMDNLPSSAHPDGPTPLPDHVSDRAQQLLLAHLPKFWSAAQADAPPEGVLSLGPGAQESRSCPAGELARLQASRHAQLGAGGAPPGLVPAPGTPELDAFRHHGGSGGLDFSAVPTHVGVGGTSSGYNSGVDVAESPEDHAVFANNTR